MALNSETKQFEVSKKISPTIAKLCSHVYYTPKTYSATFKLNCAAHGLCMGTTLISKQVRGWIGVVSRMLIAEDRKRIALIRIGLMKIGRE